MTASLQAIPSEVVPGGISLGEAKDGAVVVGTRCVQCDRTVSLECREEFSGKPVRPTLLALKFARLILCARCADADEAREAAAQTRAARDARAHDARIPKAFHGLNFDDMLVSTEQRGRAIERLRNWAAHPDPGGVLLHGGIGVGKTRLAATATWARLHAYRIQWVSVAVLFAQLTAAFSADERKDALRVLTGAGGLVLDDLDKIPLSDGSRSHLFVAIDRRVQAGAPLLVTSNLTPAGLAERFGEAIASRINGYCAVFELDGPDHRLAMEV